MAPADKDRRGSAHGSGEATSFGTMLCYANFYLSANSFFAIYQATRGYVYRDTLKMSLGTLSWILAVVKGLDIATGAVIGRLSDKTTSRWGRRKPYIAVAFPCGLVAFLLMPVGGFLFRRTSESVPCHDIAGIEANSSGECPVLRSCLEAAMGDGTIFAPDAAETPFGTSPDEAAIAVWFALVYSCYFTFYISGSVLVYDALGQELTDNYHRRGQLFALKSFLGMLGALCGIGVQLVVYGMFPTDTLTAATVTTAVLVAYGLFSYVLLLWGVAEKQLSLKEVPAIPLTAALMRMMRNPPYRWYLLMKVPMTFLGQLPYQLVLLFYQNNMRMENVSSHYLYTLALALTGAFLSIPIQLKLSQTIGRKQTLTVFLAVLSVVFLLCTFVPFHAAPTALFPVGLCLGVCITLPSIIPDAILGDIIDYDELLTGTRSEAMYTTVETNIQQGIELLLTAASLCMALAGYSSLGGCECGCGVSCKVPGYTYYGYTYYGCANYGYTYYSYTYYG